MTQPVFRPIGNRYLVLPDPVEAKETAVGEYTIQTDTPNHKKATTGTVVARGRACTEVKVGDRVVYGQYSGYVQPVGGVEHVVLQESELLGELSNTPFD